MDRGDQSTASTTLALPFSLHFPDNDATILKLCLLETLLLVP
jgi:hypothetical protein